MWVYLGLLSAVFLSIYDVSRKAVLRSNPVIPVLFLACATGSLIFLPMVVLSRLNAIAPGHMFYVAPQGLDVHLLFFLKSVIVGSSWFLGYFAISKLPLSIIVPIRSTGPMWTLFGAMVIFSERFNLVQWAGIATVLLFFYIFTLSGRREGIHFAKNKWIFAIVGATMLGAVSGLYDKHLLLKYDRIALQAWFSIYMVIVLLPALLFIWYPNRHKSMPFNWRPGIHVIGIALVVADFFYFFALSHEGSLIAILSIIRRSSVIFSFIAAAILFKEKNIKRKAFALAGILIGVVMLIWGSVG